MTGTRKAMAARPIVLNEIATSGSVNANSCGLTRINWYVVLCSANKYWLSGETRTHWPVRYFRRARPHILLMLLDNQPAF
ncbi:hypothetical protein ACPOL_0599 [Acidisarcina polymorpha]|uniref:Uncharacterized protein n=1 Tax=Acidisarcina polymorpha TaxID=2211140 RepID=A0A2Z5FT27_9BACT|nr:hypothetical protein ACPOL_0599 [Acidisarcina polymorpha]